MTLRLAQDTELLTIVRRGGEATPAAFAELVRQSYPEVWRTLTSVLGAATESVNIEPGDTVLVRDDCCVMQRDKLVRRRFQRRDEEHRLEDGDLVDAPPHADDYWKEFDAPRNGVARIEWDRGYWGQDLANEQRTGRVMIATCEALSVPIKEFALKSLSDSARREFSEAFATRCIPLMLNQFFGVRAFLGSPDTLLVARADQHGTDKLQAAARNPPRPDSQYIIEELPRTKPEAFRFFEALTTSARESGLGRAEKSVQGLPKSVVLDILTLIAVPQFHGTLGNLLRMQFVFIQPFTVLAANLANAGAVLQPAWDMHTQLRILSSALASGLPLE